MRAPTATSMLDLAMCIILTYPMTARMSKESRVPKLRFTLRRPLTFMSLAPPHDVRNCYKNAYCFSSECAANLPKLTHHSDIDIKKLLLHAAPSLFFFFFYRLCHMHALTSALPLSLSLSSALAEEWPHCPRCGCNCIAACVFNYCGAGSAKVTSRLTICTYFRVVSSSLASHFTWRRFSRAAF